MKREEPVRGVLVTGGAGFIGSHVVRKLLGEKMHVVVLDNLSSGTRKNLAFGSGTNLEFMRGDILDSRKVKEALRGVDSVVHLAALVSVQESLRTPSLTYKVNLKGTENLLGGSVEAGIKKFVLASTCAVYGNARRLPIAESARRRPLSPYADSKAKAEDVCRSFADRIRSGLTILRFFNVYGPGQERSAYANVITTFVGRLSTGRELVVYGDGRQTRDFVHVYDVAEAISLALRRQGSFEVLNLGSGHETSVNGLVETLSEIVGRDGANVVHARPRSGEIRRSLADISRLRDTLGFSPKVTLEEGLRELLKT